VPQLVDREFLQLRAQPPHRLDQPVESRSGIVELAAGPIVSSRAASAAAIAEKFESSPRSSWAGSRSRDASC
jgi:hypothetical protein